MRSRDLTDRRMREGGLSLIEILAVVALLSIGLLVVVPSMASLASAGRAASGARHMAGTFQAMRWKSVSLHKGHGLLFEQGADGWAWVVARDGNGNGLRTAEVRRGIDPVLSGPHRLESLFEHVSLGFPPGGPFPRIPPRSGWIDTTDPVQFGRSNLVGFGPLGTASSGTLYVSDGRHRLYAVVLYGRTAKIRIWRYDTRTGRWKR